MKDFEPAVRQITDFMRRARNALGIGDETNAADHVLPEREWPRVDGRRR